MKDTDDRGKTASRIVKAAALWLPQKAGWGNLALIGSAGKGREAFDVTQGQEGCLDPSLIPRPP